MKWTEPQWDAIMKDTYKIYWNGKQINEVKGLETTKQTVMGIERDFGPLPKGTLTYRKAGGQRDE